MRRPGSRTDRTQFAASLPYLTPGKINHEGGRRSRSEERGAKIASSRIRRFSILDLRPPSYPSFLRGWFSLLVINRVSSRAGIRLPNAHFVNLRTVIIHLASDFVQEENGHLFRRGV